MFIVFLRFADKAKAGPFMTGHKEWLAHGFADGVFVLSGSLAPNQGGGILAHGTSRAELEQRVGEDPFVAEGVVRAEIVELTPSKADERLTFLLG
jgi:uncharacterized protein YciI